MLLILDISTWIENECLTVETAITNILVSSISAGLMLLNDKYAKLFAVSKKANNTVKSFYNHPIGFSFTFISYVLLFYVFFLLKRSLFAPFLSHNLAFLTRLIALAGY